MTERDPLDDLFAVARANPPRPSADFMARVLADGIEAQPAAPGHARPALAGARPRSGLFARLVSALGGAVAVAGIGTATMAGLVIGYVQPDTLVSVAESYGLSGSTSAMGSLDLFSGYDSLVLSEPTQ